MRNNLSDYYLSTHEYIISKFCNISFMIQSNLKFQNYRPSIFYDKVRWKNEEQKVKRRFAYNHMLITRCN